MGPESKHQTHLFPKHLLRKATEATLQSAFGAPASQQPPTSGIRCSPVHVAARGTGKAFGAFQIWVVWITNTQLVLQFSVIGVEVNKFESQLCPLQCGWFCSVASELVYPGF